MTGTRECAAKRSMIDCSNVRIITTSTIRDTTRATSSIGSPRRELRVAAIQVDRDAAELVHAGLERDARARRRLLEHHRERAIAQRLVELVALEPILDPARALEQVIELVARKVAELQEMPGWGSDHRMRRDLRGRESSAQSKSLARAQAAADFDAAIENAIATRVLRLVQRPVRRSEQFGKRASVLSEHRHAGGEREAAERVTPPTRRADRASRAARLASAFSAPAPSASGSARQNSSPP